MDMPYTQRLSATVDSLLAVTGENQTHLARSLRQAPSAINRKIKGHASWSFEDLDGLAAHFEISGSKLLEGPKAATEQLAPHRWKPALREAVLAN